MNLYNRIGYAAAIALVVSLVLASVGGVAGAVYLVTHG